MTNETIDYLTIGQKINEIANLDLEEDVFIELGKSFAEYVKYECQSHIVAKRISSQFGKLTANLPEFIFSSSFTKDLSCISKKINVNSENAKLTLQIFHNVKNMELKQKYGFYVEDLAGEFNDFVILDGLESFGKNAGKSLVRFVQNKVKRPIAIQAGFLHYGDYVAYEETNDFSKVDNLVGFYEDIGFKNVNSKIGQYDESVIMLHM
jgi:hypothetical protein